MHIGSKFSLALVANLYSANGIIYQPFPIHPLLLACCKTEWKLFPWSMADFRESNCFWWSCALSSGELFWFSSALMVTSPIFRFATLLSSVTNSALGQWKLSLARLNSNQMLFFRCCSSGIVFKKSNASFKLAPFSLFSPWWYSLNFLHTSLHFLGSYLSETWTLEGLNTDPTLHISTEHKRK